MEIAWADALIRAGLPAATDEDGRPRVTFGSPLPVGMDADGELVDLVFTERLARWRIREALTAAIPEGWTLHDLVDVWLGAPSLTSAIAAADYRIALDLVNLTALDTAVVSLLGAPTLPRERAKGSRTVSYDLRPLLVDLAVVAGPEPVLRARTRIHPTLGNGRPEEVVAAIADLVGQPIGIASIVRERILLADELG